MTARGMTSITEDKLKTVSILIPSLAYNISRNQPKIKFEHTKKEIISLKDFFDFLSCAYKVSSELDFPKEVNLKSKMDWEDLAVNGLVSKLLGVAEQELICAAESDGGRGKYEESSASSTSPSSVPSTTPSTAPSRVPSTISSTIPSISPSTVSSTISSTFSSTNPSTVSSISPSTSEEPEMHSNGTNVRPRYTSSEESGNFFRSSEIQKQNHDGSDRVIIESNTRLNIPDLSISKSLTLTHKIERLLKDKLENLFDEEIFYSVLPFMVPKGTGIETRPKASEYTYLKRPQTEKNAIVQPKTKIKHTAPQRFSHLSDVEVDIHVRDELKNQKKDFKCTQRLLMTKMGYFAQVTTGQKLEDMDISVHCDIGVFEWIMNWIKKDANDTTGWPELEITNVVPILVSAAFLQIDPLIKTCLKFFKENIEEVICSGTNLSCINDHVMGRLADMFKNSELDAITDKKDKILSRLFCRFIISLAKTPPERAKGHYSSIAFLYRCRYCSKIILNDIGHYIPCLPQNLRLDVNGNVLGMHSLDTSWNINKYIVQLKSEVRSWRRVYWKLWGQCHFLFCSICHAYYPLVQTNWCRYHSQPAQFFSLEDQQPALPIGRFSCCGGKTFRFEALPNPTGCSYRTHSCYQGHSDIVEILDILKKNANYICLDPPEIKQIAPQGLLENEISWWEGLEIAPPKLKKSLLSWAEKLSDDAKQKENNEDTEVSPKTCKWSRDIPNKLTSTSPDGYESSSIGDGEENSEESPRHKVKKTGNVRRRGYKWMNWDTSLSTRCNQDNQRETEEKTLKRYMNYLSKRSFEIGSRPKPTWSTLTIGGTYCQLEEEWREMTSPVIETITANKSFRWNLDSKNIPKPHSTK